MIDDIKAEMTKKLEELAMAEPVTAYINMFYLVLSFSDADRRAYITEISDPLWCADLVKNSYDRARLALLKSYLLLLLEQHYHIATSLLPVLKSFDILGQTDTATFIDVAMNKLRQSEEFRREVYSTHNSRNASGRRNKHADEVIAIMSETWRHYPHTPKNAMIKKVYGHLKGKVSEETLARWIKEEKLGPVSVVRPCPPFRLIIPS